MPLLIMFALMAVVLIIWATWNLVLLAASAPATLGSAVGSAIESLARSVSADLPGVQVAVLAVAVIGLLIAAWGTWKLAPGMRVLFSGRWAGHTGTVIGQYAILFGLMNALSLTLTLALSSALALRHVDQNTNVLIWIVPIGLAVWAPLALWLMNVVVQNREAHAAYLGKNSKPLHYAARRRSAGRVMLRFLLFLVPGYLTWMYLLLVVATGTFAAQMVTGDGDIGPWPLEGIQAMSPTFWVVYAATTVIIALVVAFRADRGMTALMRFHIRHEYVRMMVGVRFITMTVAAAVLVSAIPPIIMHAWWTGLTWILVGGASLGIYVWWSNRWRGEGYSPSLLSGILPPRCRPGQVWYGWHFPDGRGTEKQRPLVILAREGRTLTVCYFTSGKYAHRSENADQFVIIEQQSKVFRGLRDNRSRRSKDTGEFKPDDTGFIQRRAELISQSALTTFVGPCPKPIYELLCQLNQVTPPADPRVVEGMATRLE